MIIKIIIAILFSLCQNEKANLRQRLEEMATFVSVLRVLINFSTARYFKPLLCRDESTLPAALLSIASARSITFCFFVS